MVKRLKSRRLSDSGSRLARILIAIFSTIGVIDTGSITLKKWGIISTLSCPGGGNGCDAVLNSPWGTIYQGDYFNLPLSFIGFIVYSIVLLLSLAPLFRLNFLENLNFNYKSWWGIFFAGISMSVFSTILLGIMVFKINAICVFCILSAILSYLILISSIIGGSWEDRRDLIFPGLILSLIIILGSLIWSSQVEGNGSSSNNINQLGVPPVVINSSNKSKIELAEYLTSKGVVMYNAYWCPHCHDQKELFGKEASAKLNLVECAADGLNNQRDLCLEKDIKGFPSWEINGTIDSGVKSLEELAKITGYDGSNDF